MERGHPVTSEPAVPVRAGASRVGANDLATKLLEEAAAEQAELLRGTRRPGPASSTPAATSGAGDTAAWTPPRPAAAPGATQWNPLAPAFAPKCGLELNNLAPAFVPKAR